MRRLAVLTLALAAAAAPAQAAEPEALAPVGGSPAAVALAGEDVLHASGARGRRVLVARPGTGAARRLFDGLAATTTRVALAGLPGQAAFSFTPTGVVFAGPAAGPFARAARGPGVALAPGALITVESAGIVARVAGGGVELVAPPSPGAELHPLVRAAGTFVAYAERAGGRDTAVVVDRRTGEQTTRLALAGRLEDLDVQEDGTLALATVRTRAQASISWTAPGRPGVRELARGSRGSGVRIAGGRVAYVRDAGIGRELAVSDLDGFTGPVSFPVAAVTAFDFDGARLAFATPGCLYAADATGGTVPTAPPAGPCPRTQIATDAPRSVALSAARRTVSAAVACPMATAAGCSVTLSLSRSGRRLAAARARVPRGARRTVTLRLSRDALRTLPRRSTATLTARSAGDAPVTRHPVVLTAPGRSPTRPGPPRRPDEEGGGEFLIG